MGRRYRAYKKLPNDDFICVGSYYLNLMGRVAKYKEHATSNEIAKLTELMQALKRIPKQQAQFVLVRYFKMGTYDRSKDKYLEKYPTSGVHANFKGRAGKIEEVAKVLGVNVPQARRLETWAFSSLADALAEMKSHH